MGVPREKRGDWRVVEWERSEEIENLSGKDIKPPIRTKCEATSELHSLRLGCSPVVCTAQRNFRGPASTRNDPSRPLIRMTLRDYEGHTKAD